MSSKVIFFFAVLAVAFAANLNPAPILAKVSDSVVDVNPQYTFSYNVQDGVSGDNKYHTESRNGNIVQGQYSLIEPDGTQRIVDYTADAVNGFNAIVRKSPLVVAQPAAVVPRPVVLAPAEPVSQKPEAVEPAIEPLSESVEVVDARSALNKQQNRATVKLQAAPAAPVTPIVAAPVSRIVNQYFTPLGYSYEIVY